MTFSSKPTKVNTRQGGSYVKDPKTGKTTLVEQTKPLEEKATTATTKTLANKSAAKKGVKL